MKFAKGKASYFKSVGFLTDGWRHSIDGLNVLCHSEFAETLLGDLENDINVTVYDIKSDEFKQLIQDEFTEKAVEVIEEPLL